MLNSDDYEILKALSEEGGYTTGSIRARSKAHISLDPWTRSSCIRRNLLHMQKERLVKEMDDKKPTCWLLTEKGVEALRTRDTSV